MNDDDDLKPYDLSAWDAPPPPANLANRVIARMVAADDAMAIAREHQPRRRWWIAGGIAAALVAVTLGVWIGVRETSHGPDESDRSGAVVADKPRALELGPSSASLDAGADVRWRRDGNVLHVEQRAGAATWKVGGSDQLVIDAGAAVASVEARNANVRVEVQMNMSDMRVVAGSAATAAAVALVTAVVYEGYVRVGGAHQTVVVQPGTSVEVRPGQPPREVPSPTPPPPQPLPPAPANGAELVVKAGESATIHVPTSHPVETQAVVQIESHCKTRTSLHLSDPTSELDGEIATLGIGRHAYEIRCDGAPAPTYVGVIELVPDDGTGHVMDRAPRKGISLDGRTYTLSVQGAFPVIDLDIPATASQYRLDLERDGAPYMTLEGADPGFTLDATALKFGTYLIRTRLDGKLASTTKLVVEADRNAAIASIAEPVNGQHWSSPLRVAGIAIPGAQVTVSGIGIVVGDDRHRFVADLDLGGASTLAIRVEHPQFGVHYFLRRGAITVATAPSHGKPVIAILGLEPATSDRMLVQVAKDVTENLRARAKAGTGPYQLAPGTDKELVDEKLLQNCESEAPACMAAIGTSFGADVMMFGHLEPQGSVYQVTIKLLDVRAKAVLRSVTAETPKGAGGADLALLGKQLYAKLSGESSAPATPACDADALFEKGKEAEGLGQHAVALQSFEAMLACKPDQHAVQLAFMASCNLGNVAKARAYWQRMPLAERTRVAPICLRNHITQDQLDRTTCDADKLREEGTQDEGLGQHAAALKAFEASIACRPDAHTTELAFLASCNAMNVAKARTFWKQMAPTRRDQIVPLCERNGITRDRLDEAATGTLVLRSNPAAKVLIDGKDIGQTTPIKGLALAPGTYKVTLVVAGADTQIFKVTIEAGKTTTVSKQLDTPPEPSCDAEHLRDKGVEAEGLGQHAMAVMRFKQALRCKPDEKTLQLAFMASCNASDITSAKTFWRKLPMNVQNRLFQLCVRNHITRDQLDAP